MGFTHKFGSAISLEGGVNVAAADGTEIQLTTGGSQYQYITPSATTVVKLPEEADNNGAVRWIRNAAGATHALTIQNDAGGAVGSVAATKTGLYVCDGTQWVEFWIEA